MKTAVNLIACGALALLATTISLRAQTSTPPPAGTNPTSGSAGGTQMGSPAAGTPSSSVQIAPTVPAPNAPPSTTAPQPSAPTTTYGSSAPAMSNTPGSASGAMTAPGTSLSGTSTNPGTSTPSTFGTAGTNQSGTAPSGQPVTQQPANPSGGGAADVDGVKVATFVQQLDSEGPAVADQFDSEFGEMACSPDTVRSLVEALHDGTTVVVTSTVNGQQRSTTFTPPPGTHLSYGDAYVALALAAEELRNSGVDTCASGQEWRAALLGGPITTAATAENTAPVQFPGIIVLHSEGRGWAQVAQATNVQLGRVLNGNNQTGAPTGYSSSQTNAGYPRNDSHFTPSQEKHGLGAR